MRGRLVGILFGLIALIGISLWILDSYGIDLHSVIDKTAHIVLVVLCIAFIVSVILWVLSAWGVKLPFLDEKV